VRVHSFIYSEAKAVAKNLFLVGGMYARRIFFPVVGKLKVWEQKSSSGVEGFSPGSGLATKTPEADDRL